MPKRGIAALGITTVALILLLSFKTPDDVGQSRSTGNVAIVQPGSAATPRPRSTALPDAADAPAAATPAPATKAPATPAPTMGSGADAETTTVSGPAVSTRWGPVQVEIVVGNGRLQDVNALQLPTGGRSGEISQYSEPILREEALQAQSADIDTVSGATYTSDAYSRSLQAALDQAGIS